MSIVSKLNHMLLKEMAYGPQQTLPTPTMTLACDPPHGAYNDGDICRTISAVKMLYDKNQIVQYKMQGTEGFVWMTAGIYVRVLEKGTDGCGRRIKVCTRTFTGPAEGWVSVVNEDGQVQIAPAVSSGTSSSSSRTRPMVKRGHESAMSTAEVEEFFKRRRRYWY